MSEERKEPVPYPGDGPLTRFFLGVGGIAAFLFGFHPGGEIMISVAAALYTWRDIARGGVPK